MGLAATAACNWPARGSTSAQLAATTTAYHRPTERDRLRCPAVLVVPLDFVSVHATSAGAASRLAYDETRHAANWHTPGCDVSRSSQRPGPALSPLQDTCSCSLTSHLSLHQAVTQTWRKTTRSGQRRSITREEKTKEQSFSGRRLIHAVTATWHRRDSHAADTSPWRVWHVHVPSTMAGNP
jgi:hypothetical protein